MSEKLNQSRGVIKTYEDTADFIDRHVVDQPFSGHNYTKRGEVTSARTSAMMNSILSRPGGETRMILKPDTSVLTNSEHFGVYTDVTVKHVPKETVGEEEPHYISYSGDSTISEYTPKTEVVRSYTKGGKERVYRHEFTPKNKQKAAELMTSLALKKIGEPEEVDKELPKAA